MARALGRACLGFAVGALVFSGGQARAQVVTPPGSEVPIPPKPKTDSTKQKTDTIKAPFGRAPILRTADIGPQYDWDREKLFASGAYTLADLLDRVPELTTFRTGWLASPKFAAVNGDFTRIRVFYDDVELDNLDTRSGSMLDLTTVDIWTLEHVTIERGANEVRIRLRSWRADNTDPYTRTDIYTGDENTNLYRGFYGKRWDSGAGLQLAGQNFGTRSRVGGGGDALSLMGRFGVAKKMWSVDAFGFRRNASRSLESTFGEGLALPPFEGTHTLAYLRAAVGNPAGGGWAHAIASFMRLAETSPHNDVSSALSRKIIPDTTDTTTKRAQYVLAGGYTKGLLSVSGEDRIRAFDGNIEHTPSARLELGGSRVIASLYGEHNGLLGRTRGDAIVRLNPLPLFAVSAAASYESPDNSSADSPPGVSVFTIPKTMSARIEAGVRLARPWLIGGLVTRDTAVLAPPTLFDSAYAYRSVGRRTGFYAGLRGQLYKDLNVDVFGTRWDSAGFYQPKYQTRSELNLTTRWLKKFPSGNFGLKVAAAYEYRGEVSFPTATGIRTTGTSGIASGLLEIRILRGVATYQIRNSFGSIYQIVPGFIMPRALSIYGLRWEFSN
jgi:hypothetical protein